MLQVSVVDVVLHFLQCLFADSRFQLTFPNGHYPPAHFLQLRLVAFVSLLVPFDFILPEVCVAVWNMAIRLVAVPKTAVNEDHDAVFAQYNVGRTRQLLHILAIAVAPMVQVAADDKLRLRVLAFDPRHDGRTFLFVPNIHTHTSLLQIY